MTEYVLTFERAEVDDFIEAVYRLFQARGWGGLSQFSTG